MAVLLSSSGPGGVRAVAYRDGTPFARVYLGADVRAEPLAAAEWGEVPVGEAAEAAPFPGSAFCGWYRLPRVGLAAVFGAVEARPAGVGAAS